jgi:tRNA A-37 threonylcarbamoyl transferase component Bud32
VPKVTAIDLDADGTAVVRHEAPAGPAAERLRRETTTLVLARGPGVVELVDSGDDEHGGAWLTTRYVGGGTLPDLARTAGHDGAIRALGQVADTLADLHERGIVHGRVTGDHVVGGARALLCGFAGAQVAAVDDAIDRAVDTAAFASLVASTCSTDDGPARLARAAAEGLVAVPPTTDLRAVAQGLRAAVGVSAPGAEPPPATPARGRVLAPRTPPPAVRRRGSGRWSEPPVERSAQVGRDGVLPRPAGGGSPSRPDPGGDDPASTGREALPGRAAQGPSRRRPSTRPDGSTSIGRQLAAPRPASRWGRRAGVRPPGEGAGQGPARGWSRRPAVRLAAGFACAVLVAFAVGALAGRQRAGRGDEAARPTTTRGVADDGHGPGADRGTTPDDGGPPAPTTTADTAPLGPSSAPTAPSTEPTERRPIDPPPVGDAPAASAAPAPEANVVSHDGARYRIGDPGDLVVVGDWDCDGSPTPTVVRPADGSVWTFPTWAPTGAPVGAEPVGVAPSPASAAVTAGPDGCDELTVTTTDGRTVAIVL